MLDEAVYLLDRASWTERAGDVVDYEIRGAKQSFIGCLRLRKRLVSIKGMSIQWAEESGECLSIEWKSYLRTVVAQ